MVIDQLTKKKYFIPCIINKNGIIAEAITYLLFNNVYKLHDFPLSITLNWGFQFI